MALQVSALRTREGCNGCGAADACMHTCIYVQCMWSQYATLFTFWKLRARTAESTPGRELDVSTSMGPSAFHEFHRATSDLEPSHNISCISVDVPARCKLVFTAM